MKIPTAHSSSTLTDDELQTQIDNRPKYLPETIETAVAELQSRGVAFTDEELQVINEDLAAQRNNASVTNRGYGIFNNDYKHNIVEDAAAPSLYSKRAISVFTVLFSILFGAIMLAVNLWKIKNTAGALWTLLFGAGFLTLQIIITMSLNSNSHSAPAYIFGLVAALIIDVVLWPRFIGNATFYRARPVWVPLIIALAFCGIVIAAIILGQPQ
jgi:hypothetical protein